MRNPLLLIVPVFVFAVACSKEAATSAPAQPVAAKAADTSAPNAAPTVTLAQLVATPDAYEGKNVIVGGTYNGACGDGDYYFKDKFDLIEFELLDPSAVPTVEKLAKGTRVRLHGKVKVRRHESEEPSTETAEQKEERESDVRIAANLVEVIK